MKILVVDDTPLALLMLRTALTTAGHEVIEARDGAAALQVLRATDAIRMVVMDWEMPGMSGPELCRQIRSSSLGDYLYLILLTSHNTTEDKVAGLSAGADDFITKPFEPAELLARVASGERMLSLETHTVVIFSLAKLAESRDPETGAHLERVQHYSQALARELAGAGAYKGLIDAEFIRLIYDTSPLHDIGKVAIPDSVLLKPARLSDAEYQTMKQHTVIGARTLEAALTQFPKARFLNMARAIAIAHHERWDGTGYPHGLKGYDIPLEARIVALADVYDALTAKRVYKAAMVHDVAKAIIEEGTGTHFDPACVEGFQRCHEQFKQIRDRFTDEEASATASRAANTGETGLQRLAA